MKFNWQTKKLGDIGTIFNGNSINEQVKKEKYLGIKDGLPFIATKDINLETHAIGYGNGVKIPFFEKSFKVAHAKSVLICAEGGSAGKKIAFNEKDICFGNKLFAIETKKNINPKFVYYWYLTPIFSDTFKKQMNGIIGGVSVSNFKNLEISFPSISEQHRIIKILDETFEQIEKVKENAEENLKNVKELFDSYLQNIFEKQGKNWEEQGLADVCEKITDGTHQTPTYYDEGIIFLSSRNVTSGKINWEKIKYIDEKQHLEMHKRVAPRVNDILLAKNGTTGVAALVDKDIVFDIYVSLALLRAREMIIPTFLLYFVNSKVAKKQFNKRLKGSGVPNLHLEEIREVIISFPKSITEQKNIVKKLDSLSEQTKKLELIYKQKLANLEELKKSILQKAFSGEL